MSILIFFYIYKNKVLDDVNGIVAIKVIVLVGLVLQIVTHFTAAWCIPSVAMNPFFEELASSFPDVLFLTVDVDEVKVIYLIFVLKK